MKQMLILFFFICTTTLLSQQPQWRLISTSPDPNGRMDDIFFINENTGWTIGLTGSFPNTAWQCFKTTDGGFTWNTNLVDSTINPLRCIGFADSINGWIGTLGLGGTNIFRTTDGGSTWLPSLITSPQDSIGICGISVINKDTVYATGRYSGPAKFYKTTNGGLNWTITDLTQYGIYLLIDCHFFNADSGFITGGTGITFENSRGVVLFTSDAGITWKQRAVTQSTYTWGWKISFPNKHVGYVSLERPASPPRYFFKTTDGGETWEEKIFINASISEQGIGFINENTGWIGGNINPGYQTTDGGNSWNSIGVFGTINRFRIINDTLAYACGDRVYKYSSDSTVNISIISNELPQKFNLYQNYPNPFNPVTKIKFDLPVKSFVKLIIYNSLGQKIQEPVASDFNPGSYEYQFDALGVASGVYYYALQSENYLITKRMVVLK